jgi:hypothetical protein
MSRKLFVVYLCSSRLENDLEILQSMILQLEEENWQRHREKKEFFQI